MRLVRRNISQWTFNLATTGLEKRTLKGAEFNCFVQESEYSMQIGGGWWRTVATAKVPGQRVAMTHAENKGAPPELEVELIDWGFDLHF
jgi:hypothetical protein